MSYQPFDVRRARVTVTVSRPDSTGTVVVQPYVFEQHRMRINVREGGAQFGNAVIEIWGAPPQAMNNIARLWGAPQTPQNTDSVAIDVWNGQQFVAFFQGVISWSAVNGQGMPAVSLTIEANSAMALMNSVAPPYANAGPVALTDALTAILAPCGFTLDYSQIAPTYQLKDVRVAGTPMDQCNQLLNMFPALTHHVALQRFIVRSANAPYSADPIVIAPETGMMRIPTYSSSGLQFETVFNPLLVLGAQCKMQTAFDYVNSTLWAVAVMAHTLDVNAPGGQWLTSVAATLGPTAATSKA